MRLILASGSPRRALLLSAAGFTFDVDPPHIDETQLLDEPPTEYVMRVSAVKSAAVDRAEREVVLAADTTVVHRGVVLGKPLDHADAVRMLTLLSGTTHSVLTGWSIRSDAGERFGIAESVVRFTDRTAAELRAYVERVDPFDKAGAYAIQGDDGWLIESVSGSRANVMGLPVRDVVAELVEVGVSRSATGGPLSP